MKVPNIKKQVKLIKTSELSDMIFNSLYNKALIPGKKTIKNEELKEFFKDSKQVLDIEERLDKAIVIKYQSPLTSLSYITDKEFIAKHKVIIGRIKKDEYFVNQHKYIKTLDKKANTMYQNAIKIEAMSSMYISLFLERKQAHNVIEKALEGRTLKARDITLEQAFALLDITVETTAKIKEIIKVKESNV